MIKSTSIVIINPKKKNSLKDAVIEYARSGEYHTVDDFLKAWDDANSD